LDDLFDDGTIETLRTRSPREAFEAVKDALFRQGPVSSADFAEAYEELVRRGVLTAGELERFMWDSSDPG